MLIRLDTTVVFKDCHANITHILNKGDIIEYTHDTGIYYVTALGGIYHDEATKV